MPLRSFFGAKFVFLDCFIFKCPHYQVEGRFWECSLLKGITYAFSKLPCGGRGGKPPNPQPHTHIATAFLPMLFCRAIRQSSHQKCQPVSLGFRIRHDFCQFPIRLCYFDLFQSFQQVVFEYSQKFLLTA